MSGESHRIRRQRWQVHAPAEGEALALRTALRVRLEHELQPALERAFASVDVPDRVVHLTRLEVRVALSPRGGDAMDALPSLVERAVAGELRALVAGAAAADAASGARRPIVTRTAAEERLTTLVHYLRTGALPWSAAPQPDDDAAAELRAAIADEAGEVVAMLLAGAAPRAHWFRLLQLVAHDRMGWLLTDVVAPGLAPAWGDVLATLARTSTDPAALSGARAAPPSRHASLGVVAALLEHAARGGRPDAAVGAAFVASRSPDERRVLAPLLSALVVGDGMMAAAANRFGGATSREASSMLGGDPHGRHSEIGNRQSTPHSRFPNPGSRSSILVSRFPIPETEAALADSEPDPPEALAVANAGLVLLHPYLPHLFAHAGIFADGAIAERELPRAAALLHFLATAHDEPLELELGLVKVLLGLAPHDTLSVGGGLLGPGDVQEAETLLAAAIEHWAALGRTSVGGLRRSFLRRPGLLRRAEEGWTLHVESTAFDVLLDRLPWGISVVRLPWMRDTIYTEWTTR